MNPKIFEKDVIETSELTGIPRSMRVRYMMACGYERVRHPGKPVRYRKPSLPVPDWPLAEITAGLALISLKALVDELVERRALVGRSIASREIEPLTARMQALGFTKKNLRTGHGHLIMFVRGGGA